MSDPNRNESSYSEKPNSPDLISRQEALKALRPIMRKSDYFYEILKAIQDVPPAEPERKRGKWIDKSGGIENAWNYCSVCGEQAIDLYDFCPNCGADMRGEQDER